MKKTRKRKKLCNLTPKTKWFMLNNFVNLLAFLDANICVPTPRLQNSEKKLVYIFFARNKPTFLSSPCLCVCVCVCRCRCVHMAFSLPLGQVDRILGAGTWLPPRRRWSSTRSSRKRTLRLPSASVARCGKFSGCRRALPTGRSDPQNHGCVRNDHHAQSIHIHVVIVFFSLLACPLRHDA